MSGKLTLRAVSERLAQRSGLPADVAEDFIKRYFKAVEEVLLAGEPVEIAGIGTLRRSDGEIKLDADRTLAAALNEPFAFFAPVRLNDGVTEEMLSSVDEPEPEPEPMPEPEPEPEQAQPEIPTVDLTVEQPQPQLAPEPVQPQPQPAPEPAPEPVQPQPAPTPAPESVQPQPVKTVFVREGDDEYRRIERAGNHTAIWAVGCLLLGLIVGGFSGWWFGRYCPEVIYTNSEVTEAAAPVVPVETADDEQSETFTADDTPDEDSLAPLAVDTVRIGYVSTHMAKKYYGDKNFWSYIYEENADKLEHPEHLRPGTTLVIPNPKKYNIDASDPESVRAAKQLALEIYARFR